MFSKIALVSLASAALVAAGGKPTPTVTVTVTTSGPAPTTVSQCNTGSAKCCNSVTDSKHASAAGILGGLGVVVQGIDVLVGLGCVNILGSTCSQQPVCCQNNQFNGLINIGCSPISL